MSEAAVPSFSVLNIFGNTGGRALILVMTACRNFTSNWILTVKTSLLCLLIQLTNNLWIKAANW